MKCNTYILSIKKTIYFNTNYRTEMKLVPIIMDYYLLQFDALKFFLEVRLMGGGLYLALIFSMLRGIFFLLNIRGVSEIK